MARHHTIFDLAERTPSGPPERGRNNGIKANLLQSELHELDEIKGLVTKGQQQGVLSYNEVADAVAEIDLDEADVEELYGFLEKSEIELVEDLEAGQPKPEVEPPDTGKRRRGRRRARSTCGRT